MSDLQGHPTRRTPYEIVIDPEARPHVRTRIAVKAIFAPDWESGARMLLEQLERDE